jgi:hypothetical protein
VDEDVPAAVRVVGDEVARGAVERDVTAVLGEDRRPRDRAVGVALDARRVDAYALRHAALAIVHEDVLRVVRVVRDEVRVGADEGDDVAVARDSRTLAAGGGLLAARIDADASNVLRLSRGLQYEQCDCPKASEHGRLHSVTLLPSVCRWHGTMSPPVDRRGTLGGIPRNCQ